MSRNTKPGYGAGHTTQRKAEVKQPLVQRLATLALALSCNLSIVNRNIFNFLHPFYPSLIAINKR